MANDWHLVHLGSRAAGGVSLVMVEATAVTREGRISPGDLGIWTDAHAEPLARIARFIRSQGAAAGIQLAHAGRKASHDLPWHGGAMLKPGQGAGTSLAQAPFHLMKPICLPWRSTRPVSKESSKRSKRQTRRALLAGFQIIEIHAAHGYLLHEFLSPLSNHRNDSYGGTLDNRLRLLLEVSKRLRRLLPKEVPLFVRISATDWVEGGWDVDQSVILCQRLKDIGVDLIDVSSGGMTPKARMPPVGKGYQVPFAGRIRAEAGIKTGAVGLITEPRHANEIITGGDADLVFLARELLREPYWALKAQTELGGEPSWPIQYGYAVKRRAK